MWFMGVAHMAEMTARAVHVGCFEEATDAYQMPRLVRLNRNLFGACFTLMKMIPARFILRRAVEQGLLGPGTIIVETTSGTFGLALAMQAVHLDRRLLLVSDPVIDERLYRRLTDLGAVVERVPSAVGRSAGGYQAARMARLEQLMAKYEATFCPRQYDNPDNPRSYSAVAEYLLRCLGPIDCVVGPVGSGGSMCGTVSSVRGVAPECRAIGVDSHSSVLFGHPDGPRELRGMGMSLMPANLDHRVFDQIHWTSPSPAYRATRELHQRHALFMGPSSGAAYLAARWWAAANPDALTVVMLPDEGYRYLDTVYNNEWLQTRGYLDNPLPTGPEVLSHPAEPVGSWMTYDWARRSYEQVMSPVGGPRR
jgi:cysteine synthase